MKKMIFQSMTQAAQKKNLECSKYISKGVNLSITFGRVLIKF